MTDTLMADTAFKALDGRGLAKRLRAVIAEEVADLQRRDWPPKLVSVSVGDADAARLYVRNQQRAAEGVGMAFETLDFPQTMPTDELLHVIAGLNLNPTVTGIIIQRPVPAHIPVRVLQKAVHPLKDVEGMHPSNIGDIVYDDLAMGPCTAVAAVQMLKETKLELGGLEVCVVGHSAIVGKPIAFLLMAQGCTVTVCHHMTRNLRIHCRSADAVFVAVGKPGLITGDMIKPGAAVIDIGINQIETADGPKVVGDADYESCAETAGWITPVPGGVGPVTVTMLLRNAVTAATRQKQAYESKFTTKLS